MKKVKNQVASAAAELLARRAKGEMINWIISRNYPLLITFCHNRPVTETDGRRLLGYWTSNVASRVFYRQARGTPLADKLEFVAFPERTVAGDLHWHAPAFIAAEGRDYFIQVAARLWSNICPGGTLDVRLIGTAEMDAEAVAVYVTKEADLLGEVGYVLSNDLDVRVFIGSALEPVSRNQALESEGASK